MADYSFMPCSSCGRHIPSVSRTCPFCAAAVRPKKRFGRWLGIFLLICLLVGSAVFLIQNFQRFFIGPEQTVKSFCKAMQANDTGKLQDLCAQQFPEDTPAEYRRLLTALTDFQCSCTVLNVTQAGTDATAEVQFLYTNLAPVFQQTWQAYQEELTSGRGSDASGDQALLIEQLKMVLADAKPLLTVCRAEIPLHLTGGRWQIASMTEELRRVYTGDISTLTLS